MDPLQLLIILALTGMCGAFAELIVGFDPGGLSILLLSLVVGLIGTLIGGLLADALIPSFLMIRVGNQRIDLLWGVLGSVVVLGVLYVLQLGGRAIFGRT